MNARVMTLEGVNRSNLLARHTFLRRLGVILGAVAADAGAKGARREDGPG